MQTQNRLFDDLARVLSSAMGVATDMRHDVEERIRQQFEHILGQMELVTREEFDTVKEMAAKARAEQDSLAARVAKLEAELAALQADKKAARPASKAAARKSGTKGAATKPAKD